MPLFTPAPARSLASRAQRADPVGVNGRGRNKPGTRAPRPGSSRPARTRGSGSSSSPRAGSGWTAGSSSEPAKSPKADQPTKTDKPSKADKFARPSLLATAKAAALRSGDPESSTSVPAVAGWRARLERARKNRRTKQILVLSAAVVFLAILVGPTLKAFVEQKQQISALREQVVAQEKDVAALQAEQARWEDKAYIEQQARERLKFVKVGEKAYTVIDPQDTPAEVPGMATAARDSAWYVTVWSSLQAADAPAAVP